MVQITPTLLTKNEKELKEKLKKIKGIVSQIHLDVIDGRFVPVRTVQLEEIKNRKLFENFEVSCHLMVQQPEKFIDKSKKLGIKNIIVQAEKLSNQEQFIKLGERKGVNIGLALDIETSLDFLEKSVLSKLKGILIMLVKAGWGGQKMRKEGLIKVRKLAKIKKEKNYHFKIIVDGGINQKNAKICIKAGAEVLAVGSAIWQSKNIKETIKNLKNF